MIPGSLSAYIRISTRRIYLAAFRAFSREKACELRDPESAQLIPLAGKSRRRRRIRCVDVRSSHGKGTRDTRRTRDRLADFQFSNRSGTLFLPFIYIPGLCTRACASSHLYRFFCTPNFFLLSIVFFFLVLFPNKCR